MSEPHSYRPGNLREEPDSGHDICWYSVVRGYASVPEALILRQDAKSCTSLLEAKYLFSFTTGETGSFGRTHRPHTIVQLQIEVREQAVTAALSRMGSRTPLPQGATSPKKYPWPITTDRVKIPHKKRSGFRQQAPASLTPAEQLKLGE